MPLSIKKKNIFDGHKLVWQGHFKIDASKHTINNVSISKIGEFFILKREEIYL